MSEKKVNYGEYIILGMNKAMLAFLISFLLCVGLSLVVNLHFYEELVALTVGGLGEATSAGAGTILRTAALILGLSNFQMSGNFQLGLLILAVIPFLAFWVSGIFFRVKKQDNANRQPMGIHVVIDGFAALIYSIFILVSGMVAKGELFGLPVDFVSLRNFIFTLLFAIFVQFFLGMNEKHTLTVLAAGLGRTRKLLRLILSFSALTGILFVLYYLTPYIKGIFKIAAFIVMVLPNLAVYFCFLLMGITIDVGQSIQELSSYVPMLNLGVFTIPTSIRVVLIFVFILIVLIMLVRIPAKQYWQNLLVFVFCFSISTGLLAMASRVNLGFKGMLNVHLEISLWKAFLVPFILISLDGILLALIRMLCREVNGDKAKGLVAAFICGLDSEMTESLPEIEPAGPTVDSSAFDGEEEPDEAEPEAAVSVEEKEIDIWKELAARPIPTSYALEENAEKKKPEKKSFFSKVTIKEEPARKTESLRDELSLQPAEERREKEKEQISDAANSESPTTDTQKKEREIDISLFPRKKKLMLRGLMDFSDMEDDIFVDEYEAEETLDDFVEKDDFVEEIESAGAEDLAKAEEMEQTRVVGKVEIPEETWEKTITYKIHHRSDN